MKNGIKTLATWLVLGLIFMTLLSAVVNNSDYKMSYSELLNKISTGEVSEVVISSDSKTARVMLKSAETGSDKSETKIATEKEVIIPSLDSFMEQVSDNIVSGQLVLTQEEESIVMAILGAFSPFIILIVF